MQTIDWMLLDWTIGPRLRGCHNKYYKVWDAVAAWTWVLVIETGRSGRIWKKGFGAYFYVAMGLGVSEKIMDFSRGNDQVSENIGHLQYSCRLLKWVWCIEV